MLCNQFMLIMLSKGRCQKHTEGFDSFLGGRGVIHFPTEFLEIFRINFLWGWRPTWPKIDYIIY